MSKSNILISSYKIVQAVVFFIAVIIVLSPLAPALTSISPFKAGLPVVNAQITRANYFVGAWPYQVPPQGHFNTFVTGAITLGIYYDLIQSPLGIYIWHNNTWIKLLASDWKFDTSSRTFTVKLRSDAKWSDGSQLTSKDVKCTWLIYYMLGHALFNYVDPKRIETPDPQTVVFHITTEVAPQIVERYVIRTNVRDYRSYGTYCDQIQSLLDQGKDRLSKEVQDLNQNFTNYRPSEMLASGPFMIDVASITDAELWLKKNPNSPLSREVKFDWIRIYNGETPTVTPLVLAKEVDYATHGFPIATEKQFASIGIKILRPPTYFGPALYFNYNHSVYGELFRIKEFRQAIAYAINRTEAGYVSLGESGKPVIYMTGVPETITLAWMSQEDLNRLDPYKYDPAKAETLLKGVGLEKVGGTWYWKGKPVELEITFPAEFADWSATADNVKSQLEAFGFKVTLRAVTFTQQPIEVQESRFIMAIQSWGSGVPHPFFSYDSLFGGYNTLKYRGSGKPGMSLDMTWKTKYGTIDFTNLIIQMGGSFDIQKQREAFTKAALAFNDFLPVIPLWERLGNNPVLDGVRTCGWLPFNDPLYKNSVYTDSFVVIMILKGILYPCQAATATQITTPPAAPAPSISIGLLAPIIVIVVIAAIAAAVLLMRRRS
jgi:peptide/nickel transport system substrate-binding protein